MTPDDVLHDCARLGVKISLHDGSLRVRGPAGAVTPELRAALTTHKVALLAHLSTPHDQLVPLSPAQRSLWLLHQGEPASLPAYNIRAARRFHGPLDAERLTRALSAVVARHEPLRTSFHDRGGEPWQRIAPEVSVQIARTDISHLPAEAKEADWQARLAAEGGRAFDLRTAPLFSVDLVRLSRTEHVLILNAHHLVADAWSAGLLLRELASAYAASEIPQPTRTFHFSDHVQVQRRAAEVESGRAALEYWTGELAGVPTLQLPVDFPAATAASYRGASEAFTLDPVVARELRALVRAEGATLFHSLISSFAVLLQRLSGQQDFGIGTTLAGRDSREAEELIGYCVNLVVVRQRLDEAVSFRELIRRARSNALAAFQHQAAPFDQIVHALRVPREPGVTPLFQVMFLYLQAARDEASFSGLEVEALPVPSTTAKYELSLHVEDHGDQLSGLIEYNSTRFESATIRRFIDTWQTLLRGLVATPDAAVRRLSAVNETDARRLLVEFNATATPADFAGGIAAAIQAQARRSPEAVALVHEDRAWTYAQLEAAADLFAGRLRAAGVGPECLVAVCVERSAEMLIALLAILKAGGGYLPLDPAFPADRIGFMLKDAGPILLLTQRHLGVALPVDAVPRILVDGIAEANTRPVATVDAAHPAQVAYVIYTSGSTGRPKGVMVTHGNVMNFFAGMDAQLGPGPGVWLALTSISFDISVLELFWTLARGFKVVLQSDEPKGEIVRTATPTRPLNFSLFYFSGDARQPGPGKYRLLMEGAKFADENGFAAVWTPERHFHAFGGLFPNPSVLGGALAVATRRVAIRAGSVVLPLHDPVRVAEEWATVDNLSGGRVGVSFASGWHQRDFALAPQHYAERRRLLFSQLAQVRALWRGDSVTRLDGRGETTELRTLPRPLQPELPVWITAGGDPETFRLAGEVGAGLLTHLLGQSPDELEAKIAHYRGAWRAAGHAGEGHVVVMLHTFVGNDLPEVRARVRGPFREYLRSSVDLISGVAKGLGLDLHAPGFTDDDFEALLDHAFERYFETSALMGTPASCRPLVERMRAMGVDEIACLIDFGVEEDAALAALEPLAMLRESVHRQAVAVRSVAEQFAQHAPTHLQATPSRARMLLLDPAVASVLGSLERMIVGGEALPPALALELGATVRGEVHNLYGPTETTVWSTGNRVERDAADTRIGRPLTNQQVYVLDDRWQPVPIGVTGELYIGGQGVTRGYLGRADLTAERFIPDAFGPVHGGRLYSTGDLARWRSDGTVECLGRVDDQVKILGHRIEPGEVEAVLASHPAVRFVAVTAPLGRDGTHRLVAYVVAKSEPAPKAADLREWLQGRLPDYLVPSAVMFLPALPLTPNGKINRRALPVPETAVTRRENEYVAPRTPGENLVASIWAKVLSLPRIGVHDNFFEIGGHSLLAMQMIARLRVAAGVDLPLRSVFETPTVAGIAKRLAEYDASGAAGGAGGDVACVPRDGQPLVLSFGQSRIWFIEQLDSGRSTYNVPAAIRLRGRCDPAALAASFTALGQRHEALRTRFPMRDGGPFQEVLAADDCSFALTMEDLREIPAPDRERVARARVDMEAGTPFDLAAGPLLRARLLRVADEDYLLVFVIHHIVSDGWTMGLITRELTTLYAAKVAGVPDKLPAIAAHYVDFAAWQRDRLSEETLRPRLDFWRKYLAGSAAAEIPGDRPRPRLLDGHGREYRFIWPAELTGALQLAAHREGVTLFVTLLAGFYALLTRYTQQDDLVVGTSVANRVRPEFEAMAGFFVNLLPVRVDTSGNPTFRELVARVKQAWLDGYAHQDTPFEALIDAVAPGRDPSRTPIFQTMLVLLNAPSAAPRLEGLEIELLPVENRTAKFDLTLLAEEVNGELRWIAEYRTELYSEATIARLAEHLRRLLSAAVAVPTDRLFALPLLGAEEGTALQSWNRTGKTYPSGRWIHEYPAQVAGGATALVFAGRRLSYGEFTARTDALASQLVELGVGPESLVAVFLERSFELVVALHSILKAGGAYVPLDPDYPIERIAYMLKDADVALVLTVASHADRLPATRAKIVCLDEPESGSRAPVSPRLHAGSAAYMIYTSGSTGRPKGAVNTHAGILNRLQWMQEALPLSADDRVLQKTPYSFDVSVWEFFWPLMTGATLVVAEPRAHQDPRHLIELIVAERITTLHFVPSMLRAFLDTSGVERCISLRQIICSGEELPRDLARLCQEKLPAGALHNLYGPTEAAVDVTWHACTEGDGGPVPIGKPIANLEIHVLDRELQPLPVGLPGEVYLGGIGLGRGYHGQPALTAERWIPHPHSTEPGARLYRTGDIGRRTAHGEVEYLGRVDFQVKLRGLRIELGEIDAALRSHPAVADAVCTLRTDTSAGARLVGYIVARATPLTSVELRTWLGGRLPEYMVPVAWVFLTALPLSPAGKIDRRALPPPVAERPAVRVAPRDAEEIAIAAIWGEVLGRNDAGVTDDFFELGGHSLVATQVTTRLRERCGVVLPLRVLFERTTVETLAEAVRAARASVQPVSPAVELRRTSRARRKVVVQDDGEIGVVEMTRGDS